MRKAKVTFDYDAQEDDELDLKIGDVITEVEDDDVGWCKGLLNGKRGVFPDNFVEILKEEEEKKAPPPPSANKKPSKKKNVKLFKVNFEYQASNVDELSLAVGDIIEVLKDVEEGWAQGLKPDGKKGVFPTNFGEMLEGGSESEENVETSVDTKQEELENKQNEEMSQSTQKKVKGIGFGNIFGDGPIKLRQRSIGEADRKKNLSTAPSKTTTAKDPPKETTPMKPKKTLNYCKVMFDYQRDNQDELSLKKGEIVVILRKDTGDDGWWEGEKEENGKRIKGVFPDNFVVELTPDEAKEHERHLHAKSETESVKETKSTKPPAKEVKKVTPLMPTAKVTVNNDAAVNDAEVNFGEPTTTEHTLTHVKRPGGPKNRRKPGATERREKAAASETPEPEEEQEIEEETKPEPAPVPAPKKESVKRGVAVLPGLGGGGDAPSGETPSWLQNLKSRQSTKRPPPVIPAKEPAASEPPPWLANLKKRQSSEFAEKTTAGKEKPASKATEKPANGPALLPSTKPAAPKPAQKPTSPSPTEKPLAAWQIERQQKTKKAKTPETSEEKAPEPPEATQTTPAATETVTAPPWKANLPKKAPVALKSPTETPAAMKRPEKPPVGSSVTAPVRPKPAPPKGKPAPMAKPVSSSAVEELKSEVKHMKEEMEKIRDEMKKEILSLNSELQTERNHRISLEEEVRKLRQQMSPS